MCSFFPVEQVPITENCIKMKILQSKSENISCLNPIIIIIIITNSSRRSTYI